MLSQCVPAREDELHRAPATFCIAKLTDNSWKLTLLISHLPGGRSKPGMCSRQGYPALLAGPLWDAQLWNLWSDEAVGKEAQALKIGCLW